MTMPYGAETGRSSPGCCRACARCWMVFWRTSSPTTCCGRLMVGISQIGLQIGRWACRRMVLMASAVCSTGTWCIPWGWQPAWRNGRAKGCWRSAGGPARMRLPGQPGLLSGMNSAACSRTTLRTRASPSIPNAWRCFPASLEGEQLRLTGQNLLSDPDLTRTTIYFNHYLFETYRLLEQPGAFFDRMGLWFDLPAQGFKTTPEQPEPTRSDCHGWGAHPLYHYFASLLGIRPASFGFERVEIAPMPGHLSSLSGTMIHPRGQIEVALEFETDHVRGSISLPAGIKGTFRFAGKIVDLQSGTQFIDI